MKIFKSIWYIFAFILFICDKEKSYMNMTFAEKTFYILKLHKEILAIRDAGGLLEYTSMKLKNKY